MIPAHTYSDLYYFPGHSYSPLNYLDIDLESIPPTPVSDDRRKTKRISKRLGLIPPVAPLIPFYTLVPESGEYRLVVVLLSSLEGDHRVDDLKKSFYPGAMFHLPTTGFTLTLLPAPSTQTSPSSRMEQAEPSSPALMPFQQDSHLSPMPRLATLSFTYPPGPIEGERDFLPGLRSQVYSKIGRLLKDEEMSGKVRQFRRLVEDRVWAMLGELKIREEDEIARNVVTFE